MSCSHSSYSISVTRSQQMISSLPSKAQNIYTQCFSIYTQCSISSYSMIILTWFYDNNNLNIHFILCVLQMFHNHRAFCSPVQCYKRSQKLHTNIQNSFNKPIFLNTFYPGTMPNHSKNVSVHTWFYYLQRNIWPKCFNSPDYVFKRGIYTVFYRWSNSTSPYRAILTEKEQYGLNNM